MRLPSAKRRRRWCSTRRSSRRRPQRKGSERAHRASYDALAANPATHGTPSAARAAIAPPGVAAASDVDAAAPFPVTERWPAAARLEPAPTDPQRDASRALILRLLAQDRGAFARLAALLADETGLPDGEIQLLLAELCLGIVASARDASALELPADHPFWQQFAASEAQVVAATLAELGYAPDGTGGWRDGRAPGHRELAIAVAEVGHDLRRLRFVPSGNEIERLWHGTRVAVERYLASRAPDLDLDRVIRLLGPRAEALGDLWNNWGRLRSLLLAPAP